MRHDVRLLGLVPTLALLAGAGCLVWLLADPAPARAIPETPVETVLDRWAQALGGRERLSGIQTSHSLSDVKMIGLTGTVEEWLTSQGHHRLELDLSGVLKVTTVKTPDHCWQVDQNGKVMEQAGKDLEDEIADMYLSTWSHLLRDRMAGEVELLDPDPEMGSLGVRIAPEGGTETVVWLDPQTYLPLRRESPAGSGETTITRFLNWRDIGGVIVPAKIEQTTGTDDAIVIELREIDFNETPPPTVFGKPQERTEDVRFAAGRSARNIPLDIDGVHLYLQGWVNDSDSLWFLLDTGASMTCIDRDVAAGLGLELTGELTGDGVGEETVPVNLVRNASFRVPGVELTGQTVAAVGLRDILEPIVGRELDGILGYDFISRFVVEIDYWNSKLHLYDRNGWEYKGEGTEVPIRIVSGDPVCDATVTLPDGRAIDCNLYIDTGSGVAIRLNKPFTEEHDLLSALPKKVESSGGFGIGGETRDVLGRIDALKIGDLEFEAPACAFSRDDKGVGADVSLAGKLGGRILERCTVILDYERGRLLLEPNARFGTPFRGEMCGLTIHTGGRGDWHTFIVGDVIEGSPADVADIRAGDVVVSVDDVPATELRLRDLRKAFREEGRVIGLVLKRGGDTLLRKLQIQPFI